MAANWTVRPLEACMEALIDYRGKTPEKRTAGVPLITAKVVKGGRIDTPTEFIAVEDYDSWMRRGFPKVGDVLITTEAPLGEVAQLTTEKVALAQRLIALRGLPGLLDNGFLKFLMQSQEVQDQLRSRASGTTVLGIKQSELRKVMLPLPPFREQLAIAHILGTIDDKIELNHRMNETLEAMARALFKSWFVDFDPVRAKAAGKAPRGLDSEIAALFPDRFQETDLGDIPYSWIARPLSDLFSVERGLSYKGAFLADSGMPMVNLGCFKGAGRFNSGALKYYSGEYKKRHLVCTGDLLLANTDITQSRRVLGSPGLVPPLEGRSQVLFSHHVFAARFRSAVEDWKYFVYFLLLQESFRERAIGFATGTTVLALPEDAIMGLRTPMPPHNLTRAFNTLVTPLIDRQWKLEVESKLLTIIRNTLLPQLISGKLCVPGTLLPAETNA